MAKGITIKKWTIPILIGAFVLVLFFNTYFNYTSEVAINEDGSSLTDQYYLAGPDPYYNARLVEQTAETGEYPYLGGVHGSDDPLLNYPLGSSGGRPPLFNVITVSVGKFFSPIIGELDAMGNAMQFLPALYGALLVFPVYVIGSQLFNRKSGIFGAFFVALIPLHLSSGHGSAFSLYDHDSFVLLLTTTAMMFFMLSLKQQNTQKSMILAFMSGIAVASISLTWVAAQYIYTIIAVYAIAQMILDILSSKIDIHVPRATLIALLGGYLLALPLYWIRGGFTLTTPLAITLAVAVFSVIYIWLGRQSIPWVISIPSIFGLGGIGLAVLYILRNTSVTALKPLTQIADVIFGAGIYGQKVSLTIAEASTFDFSRSVMSFGPVLFLMAVLVGFPLLLYFYFKNRSRRDYFLLIMWFIVEFWLLSTAGRFLNNLVPLIAVLGGWALWLAIDKVDFAGMVQSIKGVGGGWYGLKKGVKIRHLAGIFFVVFLLFIPNGWMALDASIPSTMKRDFDSDKLGAFGLGLHTESYWTDAFMWLSQQDANQTNHEKPAFISWWDYGFYEVAMGGHPTVADNFQDGIPPAANFQTAQNEQQAVAIWIIRLAEGDMVKNDGVLSDAVRAIFEQFMGNQSQDLATIIEDPEEYANTTYNDIIGEEYTGEQYRVQAVNARYHDATKLITQLTDEQITWFYHGMQNATGNSIRYYGVEGYDLNIFNVFTFLSDKGVFGYETAEDDYYKLYYVSPTGQKYTPDELEDMTDLERQQIGQLSAQTVRKAPFYNSMVYKTYLGSSVSKEIFDNQTSSQQYQQYLYALMQPTVGMKHFSVEYVSPMNNEESLYFVRGSLCFGCPAVVIAKYYEGARITGTILSDGQPLDGALIEVQRSVTLYNSSRGITHDAALANKDGVFSVIAPAGNVTLIVSQGTGSNRVIVKEITFNSTGALAPISEADATRRSDTWKRDIGTFNLKKGDLDGTVFWDKDGDGKYNGSVDDLMSNVKIEIAGKTAKTNSQGYYQIKDLHANVYNINVTKVGYTVSGSSQVSIKPDEISTMNLSLLPKKVTVSGATWFDANNNGVINDNETLAQVSVKFAVQQAPDNNAGNVTVASNTTGYYIRSLSPASYSVSINHTTPENNQTVRYTYEGTLPIDIGDGDITMNFKLARVEE